MRDFKLPDLGEGMQEAEVRRWLVRQGEMVKLDQPMVEVETDKAVVEIPSPVAGRIADIRVPEGSIAHLGEVLVRFEDEVQNVPVLVSPVSIPNGNEEAGASETNERDLPADRRVLAAPAVRKRASELGISLADVPSSRATGRVTMLDLMSYSEQRQGHVETPSSSPVGVTLQHQALEESRNVAEEPSILTVPIAASTQEEKRQPLVGLRRRIAEHMERSWRTIPHATAFDEVDATELVALRQMLKPLAESRGTRITYMPLLIKMLIPVLKAFPIFNASLDEEKREVIYKQSYHIGIATDSPEGLLVPVLRRADQLTMMQIAVQLEHLILGAQKRTLALHEVSGSTFTLNNIGSFGGSSGTPIINYPEAAILAVGRLQEKAIIRNGSVLVRTMMPLALSFDHRLIDGALAGKFLTRFKDLVELPQQLMLDQI